MLGKLVLGAVLCLAVIQVCLARPQDSQDDLHQSLSLQKKAETRITSCRSNLRDLMRILSDLLYDMGRLYVEVLAALVESIKCAMNFNLRDCGQAVFSDTVEGLKDTISDFADNIVNLGKIIGGSLQTCLLQKT